MLRNPIRQPQARLLLFLKGMAMGAADSIPGVSGGTIAFITNIYEELIFSIQKLNFPALNILFRNGPSAFWTHINGGFLLVLACGIVLSLKLLAGVVLFLLDTYQPQLLSFFCGLILASCLYMKKQIRTWSGLSFILLLAGVALAAGLSLLPHNAAVESPAYIFFCGAIAICAMILPGISGAFILILLGAYETVLDALNNFDLMIILVFVAGCGSGLIAFSNILAYLFRHFRDFTLCFLLGILAGSLYSIWPWKQGEAGQDQAGGDAAMVAWQNVMPSQYARITGEDSHLMLAVLFLLIGFALVYGLEKLAGTGD